MRVNLELAKKYFKEATPITEEVKDFYSMAYGALNFAEDFIDIDIEKAKKALKLYDIVEEILTKEYKQNEIDAFQKLKNYIKTVE